MPTVNSITLNDFAQMVRMSAEGMFATSIDKTTGGIYVDDKGNVKNVRGKVAQNKGNAEQNLLLRQKLVEAFTSGHATAEFLKVVRKKLGLKADNTARDERAGMTLDRRVVKMLLNAFARGDYRIQHTETGEYEKETHTSHAFVFMDRADKTKEVGKDDWVAIGDPVEDARREANKQKLINGLSERITTVLGKSVLNEKPDYESLDVFMHLSGFAFETESQRPKTEEDLKKLVKQIVVRNVNRNWHTNPALKAIVTGKMKAGVLKDINSCMCDHLLRLTGPSNQKLHKDSGLAYEFLRVVAQRGATIGDDFTVNGNKLPSEITPAQQAEIEKLFSKPAPGENFLGTPWGGDGVALPLSHALVSLLPSDFKDREKYLLFATSLMGLEGPSSICADEELRKKDMGFGELADQLSDPKALGGPMCGYPKHTDLSLVKGEKGEPKELVLKQSFALGPMLNGFFGCNLIVDGQGYCAERGRFETTVTIDLTKGLDKNGKPHFSAHTVRLPVDQAPVEKKGGTKAVAESAQKGNATVITNKEIEAEANRLKLEFEQNVQEKLGYERLVEIPKDTKLHQEMAKIVEDAKKQAQDLKDGNKEALTRERIIDNLRNGFNELLENFWEKDFPAGWELDVDDDDVTLKANSIAAYYAMAKSGDTPKSEFDRLVRTLKFAIKDLDRRQAAEEAKAIEFNGDVDGFNYESEDPFVTDPTTLKMIRWTLDRCTAADFKSDLEAEERMQARVDALGELLAAILTENGDEKAGGVRKIAYSQGYGAVEEAERQRNAQDAKLTSLSANDLMKYVADSQHWELLDDPAFGLYVQQHSGEFPRECKDGQLVFKSGGWAENATYYNALTQATEHIEASDIRVPETEMGNVVISHRSKIPNAVLTKNYALDDFRSLFGTNEDGSFRTPPNKTTGTLRLALQNDGSIDGSLGRGADGASLKELGLLPETSLLLRMKLVDAFRLAGADDEFLGEAQKRLAIATYGNIEPISCSLVKDLIEAFDKRSPKTGSAPVQEPKSPVVAQSKTIDLRTVKQVADPKTKAVKSEPKAVKRETKTIQPKSAGKKFVTMTGIGLKPLPKPIVPKKMIISSDHSSHVTWAARIGGIDKLAGKILGGEWTVTNNPGGGSCFFYSVLQGESFIKTKQIGEFTKEDANRLRQELVEEEQTIKSLVDEGSNQIQGMTKIEDQYFMFTDDATSVDKAHNVTEAMKQADESGFGTTYGADADVAHGAFVASMLKRPVTIICDVAGAKTEPKAVTFDRDVKTGEKLTGEPIVIYYSRYALDTKTISGHFQVLTPKKNS